MQAGRSTINDIFNQNKVLKFHFSNVLMFGIQTSGKDF